MAAVRILSVPLFVVALVAPASAAPLAHEVAATQHCVVFVIDQAEDGELLTTDPECFNTVAAAALHAANGVPASGARFTAGGARLSSFTLGTHYDGLSGTGSSISVVGSNCSGGYWNTPASWDNRISSTRNGCHRVKHHDYAGASGSYASTWGVGVLSNVPSWMNNRAESVSYWTS